jgi:hypothetical protein
VIRPTAIDSQLGCNAHFTALEIPQQRLGKERTMTRHLTILFAIPALLLVYQSPAWSIEIGPLLDTCPQHDVAYQQIRNDFEIRRNGVPVTEISCTEPVSAMDAAHYSDELIAVQALRAALYMDLGTNQLPWAPNMRLYDWMKSKTDGFDISDTASNSYCCEQLQGKSFFVMKALTSSKSFYHDFTGIGAIIELFAHELRHVDGFPHVACCPRGAGACDQTYDEANLSPYGIERWLEAHWLTGGLYTGFSCLTPQSEVTRIGNWWYVEANGWNNVFCDTKPPATPLPPTPPGPGGLCRSNPGKVDLFIVVDLSGSFADDLAAFQAEAPLAIAKITAGLDARIGLASLQDYPIPPFGRSDLGDHAYTRLVDLTADTTLVLNTIAALPTPIPGAGGDDAQCQLTALYQAATGAGLDLSGVGYPGASISAGQQATFRAGATKVLLLWTDAAFHRPGDPGSIPYPGPTFDQTVAALMALDPARVIGISSGASALPDLQAMAVATGALAPAGGVDCDGDGVVDVAQGAPLVCVGLSSGVGVGTAIAALVSGAVGASAPVALCHNVTVTASAATCGVASSIDNGSFDPDGGPVTRIQSPPGPYRAGQNSITLTVTGASGLSSSCVAQVTVVDQTGPLITLAPNPPKPVCAITGQSVTIAAATAFDACEGQVAVTGRVVSSTNTAVPVPVTLNNGVASLPVGAHTVEWSATDPAGNRTVRQQVVNVVPAIYAISQLELRDRVKLLSGSGYASAASGGSLPTALGVESRSGDIWSVGSVTVGDRASITGQIRSTGSIQLGNQVTATGGTLSGSVLPLPPAPWIDATYPAPSGGNIALQPDKTRTIAAGSYGSVSIASRSSLTLAAGTYYFASLDLEPQGKITALGPVVLYLRDSWIDRGTFLGFETSKVAYTGNSNVFLDAPLATNLWAGSAAVVVRAAFTGQLVARGISVDAGQVFTCRL